MSRGGPLAGVKVVELEALGAVPHAAMMLADAGADVLRVERRNTQPVGDDLIERGRRSNAVLRGRRSIGVDLKDPAAQQFVLELVRAADVLVEGFRPGVAERLGVGPDRCLEVNPALVYGRLTGWGRTGPLAPRAGHDINYLALSGTLGAMGRPGEPPPVPLNVIADFGGGSMQLAFGVVTALIEARATGRGQVVDAAMVDGCASLATYVHSMRAAGTWLDERSANILDGGAPFYAIYATADDGYMAVGAIEPQFYAALLDGLGIDPDELPAQLDRSGWPEIASRFAERFRSRTRAEWERIFEGTDACVTPVLSMAEAPHHEHLLARRSFIDIDGAVQPAPVPRFARSADQPEPTPPVSTGTGGYDALLDWGLAPDRIDDLLDDDLVEATPTPHLEPSDAP